MQQERDLSELLDSQAKRGWVNLIDFQQLVGINNLKQREFIADQNWTSMNAMKKNQNFTKDFTGS